MGVWFKSGGGIDLAGGLYYSIGERDRDAEEEAMKAFCGKNIVLTGCNSGIGLSFLKLIAKDNKVLCVEVCRRRISAGAQARVSAQRQGQRPVSDRDGYRLFCLRERRAFAQRRPPLPRAKPRRRGAQNAQSRRQRQAHMQSLGTFLVFPAGGQILPLVAHRLPEARNRQIPPLLQARADLTITDRQEFYEISSSFFADEHRHMYR